MDDDDRTCCGHCGKPKQTHVHEFLGSTKLAELEEDPHNHRFAGISGEAIPMGNSHVHDIITRTDFYEDHLHAICVRSCPAICVGNGKHVHFVAGMTTVDEDHAHEFVFATLIENPIGD
ncbi:YmaF family protein [Sporomusa acidovorans]|uniref:YmaF family protein n=1 Tax=Sporomusa acidovorans (strain ATCC 49682 / DSM 3132 / Mol) TaxID=1123286 RepID=A0ABZ3JAG3_SPOA4|nr:YmaF family protein [Sporomusa acidovorans]OZC13266.1 YmaF family protein [Sporomusa acidovorans DSM 3132]SDD98679.1 YmaF family protein [Sporomusa acidovorans]